MKLLACFKVVPDMEAINSTDWEVTDSLSVDLSYVRLVWNCFDESSLEMLLKLSDLSEGFDVVYELNALTVGRLRHETFLNTLYALGFSHAVRVEAEEDVDLRFCPGLIADVTAKYVKETASSDVIVMGTQSSDGSNMKTPLLLAERLGWTCITQVTAMEPVDEKHLKVTSQEDGKTAVQVVTVPIVLAVGNAPCAYLRVPTLKDKMKLGKRPIEHISLHEELAESQSRNVELKGLTPIDDSRDTILIEGESPQEKAEKLYEMYLKGRLERL